VIFGSEKALLTSRTTTTTTGNLTASTSSRPANPLSPGALIDDEEDVIMREALARVEQVKAQKAQEAAKKKAVPRRRQRRRSGESRQRHRRRQRDAKQPRMHVIGPHGLNSRRQRSWSGVGCYPGLQRPGANGALRPARSEQGSEAAKQGDEAERLKRSGGKLVPDNDRDILSIVVIGNNNDREVKIRDQAFRNKEGGGSQ
ncbi:hypothetical protein GG344DRAFT_70770, partial [Lentinula edodes]